MLNLTCAYRQRGMPYKYGAKWKLNDKKPMGPVDCSGFVRWTYYQNSKLINDGTWAQYAETVPTESPETGDLGFFVRNGKPYHVGMLYGSKWVIEARGEPYNKVILRPRENWEKFERFSGWRTFNE